MIAPEVSAELYRACRSPDPRVHGPAYQRLHAILLPEARRRSHDLAAAGLAEDATQEALAGVWRVLASPHDIRPESFVSYCISAVMRRVVDEARRRDPDAPVRGSRRPPEAHMVRLDGPTGDGRDVGDVVADTGADRPDDLAERLELQRALAAIGRPGIVSDRSREVLLLGYMEDWTDAELAARLGTTANNVYQIRFQDLRRLRSDRSFMGALAAATCVGRNDDRTALPSSRT